MKKQIQKELEREVISQGFKIYHKFKHSILPSALSATLSIAMSVFFCFNYLLAPAQLGMEWAQIDLADKYRINCEFHDSIDWYDHVINQKDEYAPYACIAIGEIYSKELDIKRYDEAFKYYSQAASSTNLDILFSCLDFIITQTEMRNSGEFAKENPPLDLTDDEHIEFVKEVFNNFDVAYDGLFFSDINFPISDDDVKDLLHADCKVTVKTSNWEYVSTITSSDATLGHIDDNEKIILIDTYQELVSPNSASLITIYKYYKYKLVPESEVTYTSTEYIRNIIGYPKMILLNDVDI